MVKAEELFAQRAIESMLEEIVASGGNEIFFVGKVREDGRIDGVQAVARGNKLSTPAIMEAATPGEVVVHNHPSGHLMPSQADVSTASTLGNRGVGFYIIDNRVTSVYVVVEAPGKPETRLLNAEELVRLLEPNGPVSKKLGDYEYRPQQGTMMEAVAAAFNEDRIALVEAGTGTGKTMAYLIPAIRWALDNRERVVISTNTINLQEQLIRKDIPLLKKALGLQFRAVQVLGRGNYICLRKAAQLSQEPTLFADADQIDDLSALTEWMKKTGTGCRIELSFIPPPELWEKICSESDYCMGPRCPDHGRCFLTAARRKAAAAEILVINHHLLFADTALRNLKGAYTELAILPPYKHLIIDEAHTLEDIATSYFGVQLTRLGLARMLGRLYSGSGGGKGLLPFIISLFRKAGDEYKIADEIIALLEKDLIPKVRELVNFSSRIFDSILEEAAGMLQTEYREIKLRLTPQVVSSPEWKTMLDTEVAEFIARLKSLAGELIGAAKKIGYAAGESMADKCFELRINADRLEDVSADLRRVLSGGDANEVAWVEGRFGERGGNIARVLSSPVEIAPELAETLFSKIPTILFTSATLTVGNSFKYLNTRLGLDLLEGERFEELILPSPFDYQQQAVIVIPTDIPSPVEAQFEERLEDIIYSALEITGGKAFVLFTSYKMLKVVYDPLKEPLASLGIASFRQGDRPRHQLLELFKKDKSSTLFATDSFWQGVDVVGEALECVILAKLPFRVPTEPVLEARCKRIEEQGGNPFQEYIVPQAVLKFKQGFGRLIRKRSDRGAVLILDRRIIDKPYGKQFLKSLPPCKMVVGSTEEMLDGLTAFFTKR